MVACDVKVDVNARDEKGYQPLHYAYQIDRPDLVLLLAGKGMAGHPSPHHWLGF